MQVAATQIAELIQGELIGNGDVLLSGIGGLEKAESHDLTFLSNESYIKWLPDSKAGAILINRELYTHLDQANDKTFIVVEDAYAAMVSILAYVESLQEEKIGIHSTAIIHPDVRLPERLYVGPYAVIDSGVVLEEGVKIHAHAVIEEKVEIGKNTEIFAKAFIGNKTVIGAQCVIHPGAIIGADGFGFQPNADGEYNKVPQMGNVEIQDYVSIGAGTCIDRATLGSTVVEKGCKLDNLIQIGHNVRIGENTVIAAQTGVAGSATIGKRCMIGGKTAIAGHIEIGDDVRIAATSGVAGSVEAGSTIMGPVAFERRAFQRAYIFFRKLPDLARRISAIEKTLK